MGCSCHIDPPCWHCENCYNENGDIDCQCEDIEESMYQDNMNSDRNYNAYNNESTDFIVTNGHCHRCNRNYKISPENG